MSDTTHQTVHPIGPSGQPDEAISEWLKLLVQLMADLRGLGRGSSLALPVPGQPVLFVRVRSGVRSLAVLGVQDGDRRWSYLWDGWHRAAADGSMAAAHQIAAVER